MGGTWRGTFRSKAKLGDTSSIFIQVPWTRVTADGLKMDSVHTLIVLVMELSVGQMEMLLGADVQLGELLQVSLIEVGTLIYGLLLGAAEGMRRAVLVFVSLPLRLLDAHVERLVNVALGRSLFLVNLVKDPVANLATVIVFRYLEEVSDAR